MSKEIREPYRGPTSVRYRIVDVGTLGGDSLTAAGVNDAGQVTGSSYTAPHSNQHAFLYTHNKLHDLGVHGDAVGSAANAINADGVVVGYLYDNKPYYPSRGFIYRAGTMSVLPCLGRKTLTEPMGINHAGQIVGSSGAYWYSSSHAVLWTDFGRKIVKLPTLPGGKDSGATAINEAGDIVGYTRFTDSKDSRGFLIVGGKAHDLGILGGNECYAAAINNRRQVVGYSSTATHHERAFLWVSGKMTELGLLPGDPADAGSMAYGISDSGDVVGRTGATWGQGPTRAALWRDGKAYDLNRLTPSDSGWALKTAKGISPRGLIVGEGIRNGQERVFLLVPL